MSRHRRQPPNLPVKFPLLDMPSNMTFPARLREAIADHLDATMLSLTSTDAGPHNSLMIGARVGIRFTLEGAGTPGGTSVAYPVLLDLEVKAARALAQSLTEMADRAEELIPEPGW